MTKGERKKDGGKAGSVRGLGSRVQEGSPGRGHIGPTPQALGPQGTMGRVSPEGVLTCGPRIKPPREVSCNACGPLALILGPQVL